MLNIAPNKDSWVHYSGNFWWARCDYVRRLRPLRAELLDLTTHTPRTDPPRGRYLAEWWIGSIVGRNATRGDAPVRFKNCWARAASFVEATRDARGRTVERGSPKRCRGEVPDPDATCP